MTRKQIAVFMLVSSVLLITVLVGGAAADNKQAFAEESGVVYRGVMQVVNFDVSPRLDEIEPVEPSIQSFIEVLDDFPLEMFDAPQGQSAHDPDGALQSSLGGGSIPAPLITFAGPSNTYNIAPPDPNGDVGPNHVVMMSNLDYAVYDKNGAVLLGPIPNNSIWSGFGGECESRNDGDPIVIYDQLADRWMITQFTANFGLGFFYECIALSKTNDPTGEYYRWAIDTGVNFPDFPKVGMWSDGYYFTTREFLGLGAFQGIGVYALNRSEMLAGNPNPTQISFLITPGATPYNAGDGLLPADLDGNRLPPAGSPAYFVGSMDNGSWTGAPIDALTLWHLTPDWGTPANSTLGLASTIPIASFDTQFSLCNGRDCIPQPGSGDSDEDFLVGLDILSYRQRPMFRLAYRNFGTHESLVTNQSVEAAAGIAGLRWWEIRDPNGTPNIYQEGTYAPGVSDGIHRWMGSIAMDASGNMALGYSASSDTTYPSIWYTGRLVSDPLGTMPQGEGVIVNGTGAQEFTTQVTSRWGDYTSMVVDPVDDCTFWYTNQWLPETGEDWELRIGAFRFDSCESPGISVDPDAIYSIQPADTVVTKTISIQNTGTITLNWKLSEDNRDLPNTLQDSLPGQGTGHVVPPGAATDDYIETKPEFADQPSGALSIWSWPTEDVLYDNGPLVTCEGCGVGGADESIVQDNSLGKTAAGFINQLANNYWVADDFVISDPGGWALDKVTFFAYQTESSTTSTMTDLNWWILDGVPGSGGSVVASGSGISATGWTNIYRGYESSPGNTRRPVMYNEVILDLVLTGPGHYWFAWQTEGTLGSGPWAPPIEITGVLTTGNGLYNFGGIKPALDNGTGTQQGFPFIIQGTRCVSPDDVPWLSASISSGTLSPGDSTNVEVLIDSTGLSFGSYSGALCLSSNDADRPVVDIPIELVVSKYNIFVPVIIKE